MNRELDNKKMWESILNAKDLPRFDNETITQWLQVVIRFALNDQGFKFDGEHIVPIEEINGNNGGISHKFNVGDWVVRELDNTYYQIKKCILNVTTNKYGYDLTSGGYISSQDANFYHLWSIDDAKDGDVLVHSSFMFDDFVFIYNSTSILQAYCYYSNEKKRFIIEDKGHYCPWNMQEVKPATKEQRALLFQEMRESGYEWDFENKKLKKIEQKPAWSEDDETKLKSTCALIRNTSLNGNEDVIDSTITFLKSLKERVQPQSTWKPSDEQMEALETAIRFGEEDSLGILALLYNDLKKLRDE